ncbi:MAG: hypothetical protein HY898_37090 [Deltaproteobacteria bacterium]|nr:hypothetical protein [Deltaproteobacteria bacterium]
MTTPRGGERHNGEDIPDAERHLDNYRHKDAIPQLKHGEASELSARRSDMLLRSGIGMVLMMHGCAGAAPRSDAAAPPPAPSASPAQASCALAGEVESHKLVPNVPTQFGNGLTVTISQASWDHFEDGSFNVRVDLQFRRDARVSTVSVDIRRAVCGETDGVTWRLADHVLSIPVAR